MAKPIVVSNAPGCRDVVTPGSTGLMCDVKNAHSIVQCMEKFLSVSQKERDEMGQAGRQLMMKKFDEKIIVDFYLHKIPELVS